jgi:hypothetical protein
MTEVRLFKASDMKDVMITGIKEFGIDHYSPEHLLQIAAERDANGQCRSCVMDGEVVACAGVDILWPGVGEVWAMVSYEIDKTLVYKGIAKGLKRVVDDNDLWRVQGWARVGFKEAHVLFKHLGMIREGVARRYAPDGADCVLYSKVKDVTSN